jgi:hypothetical protein
VRLEAGWVENYNGNMKKRILMVGIVSLALPAFLIGQSLSEVAKEEKQRRQKIKDSGQEVVVITDQELASNQGRIANPSSSVSNDETGSTPPADSTGDETPRGPSPPIDDSRELSEESQAVTDIPADASLDQKLELLERMKASYQQQVSDIDAEIQKNNQRLAEIQEALVSTGGTGLPTAPQADMSVRNPGDIPGLRSEQEELRQKNQALEAQKQSAKNDVMAKARRAGIPASYLNF